MNRDNFFDSVFNSDEAQSFPALSYEDRIVRRLFTECGVVPRSMGRLVNICRDETGEPKLSFQWFNNYFSFPARLCGARIGYCGTRVVSGERQKRSMYQLDLSDVFRPKKNLFLRAVLEKLADNDIDLASAARPFIFVFPVRRKMYCVHNYGSPLLPDTITDMHTQQELITEPVLSFYAGNANILTMQSTAAVFAHIGNDWFSE